MNPVLYQRCQISATRDKVKPEGVVGPRYTVEVKFSEAGRPLTVDSVHLSDMALNLLRLGQVAGASIEVVPINSLSFSLLGNCRHLVTGLELNDGRIISTVPRGLTHLRRYGMASSSALAIGAGAALLAGWGIAAAVVLVLSTHALRSFYAVPHEAFPGLSIHKKLCD